MTHKNYYTFSADNHYALGSQMGETFRNEAHESLTRNKDDGFEGRKKVAEKMLQLTKIYFPQYIDELKGYAVGAGIEFIELWTLAIEDDAYMEEKTDAKCTSIITNNGKLMAHSEDQHEEGLEKTICLVRKSVRDLTTFEIYYYNTLGGVSVGVNSYGIASSVNTLLYGATQLGIPKVITGRVFLESNDIEKDYKKIQKLQLADGFSHNLTDIYGRIINIELSSTQTSITYPSSPFGHSNHCLILKDRHVANDDYGTMTRLSTAIKNAKPIMNIPEIQKLLEGGNLGPDKSIANKRTVGRLIIDLENLKSYAWLMREKELGWVEYPLDFIK